MLLTTINEIRLIFPKKKGGKLHFTPLNYPPIFTFTSKVSSVTLNPSKLSNCDNLTPLAYLFPKCPHHMYIYIYIYIYIYKKKRENTKYTYIYIYAGVSEPPHRWWPATLFALGWYGHPQAGWFGGGRTTPSATGVF
jgi:hypothetical protein